MQAIDTYLDKGVNRFQQYEKQIQWMIFLFPIFFLIVMVLFKLYYPWWYRRLMMMEDSITEYSTFFLYFFSFCIAFAVSLRHYKNGATLLGFMYMALSLGLFFIAMEEISWGQRIFGVSTPDAFSGNIQNELNFHNYKAFPLHSLYILVGFYGAFSRAALPKSIKSRYPEHVNAFTPGYSLFFYFFIVGFLYLYYEYLSPVAVHYLGEGFGWGPDHFIKAKEQEPAELLLAGGFFLFVLNQWIGQLFEREKSFG